MPFLGLKIRNAWIPKMWSFIVLASSLTSYLATRWENGHGPWQSKKSSLTVTRNLSLDQHGIRLTLGSLCHHTGWKKREMKKLGGCLSLHSSSLKSPWGDRLSQPWRTAWQEIWTLSTWSHLLTCQCSGAYSANMALPVPVIPASRGRQIMR